MSDMNYYWSKPYTPNYIKVVYCDLQYLKTKIVYVGSDWEYTRENEQKLAEELDIDPDSIVNILFYNE